MITAFNLSKAPLMIICADEELILKGISKDGYNSHSTEVKGGFVNFVKTPAMIMLQFQFVNKR